MFVTEDGLHRLEAELEELDHSRRREIADRLRAAREFGNGLENGEMLEAKSEIWRLEREISEVRTLLSQSELIHAERLGRDQAGVGSRVVLKSEFGKEEFVIVGSFEVDPQTGKISDESPLGKALIGRRRGERIEWRSPAGRSSAVLDRVI